MRSVVSIPCICRNGRKMFDSCFFKSAAQDCSGGSGELSRAVTDNSLGELEAASAWLFPVLVFPAFRHWDALVSYVDNCE